MSIKDLFTFNLTSGTHLRDARHAHQIYTQNNFTFAPKQKYMYHVVFQPNPEVGNSATSNSFQFQKELGILVKSTDLPSFKASIENKQQYNRKKNVQTRLDYQDVRMTLHDDNLGAVRSMLEEYYKYYFADGNRSATGSQAAYLPRDKYFGDVPNYGLNNKKRTPFFSYITIYQLARREWFAYTLVNPLLSSWDHGGVDSTDGGFNEASMIVAYEGVLYTKGKVTQNPPIGFSDADVGYDAEPSPLGIIDQGFIGPGGNGLIPALIGQATNTITDKLFGGSNKLVQAAGGALVGGLLGTITNEVGASLARSIADPAAGTSVAPGSNNIPTINGQSNITLASQPIARDLPILSSAEVVSALSNPAQMSQLIAPVLNSGVLPGITMSTYNNSTAAQALAIEANVIALARAENIKVIQIVSNALLG